MGHRNYVQVSIMTSNHKEILRLKNLGLSQRQIADTCGCSKWTVTDTISRYNELQLSWGNIADKTADEITAILYPKAPKIQTHEKPDYGFVVSELSKPGVTLKCLWEEYAEQCHSDGKTPYQYTQFKKYYYEHIRSSKATMHLEHKRGEVLQVDRAGTTIPVKNTYNGKDVKAYVFIATLPFSGYTYAEAFLSMKLEEWITAHVHAFTFFGGVTRILTPDNLKTGVVKNTKNETIIHPTYLEMGEHYGMAIIPARPRAPKDKAAVEGTVGKITQQIIAKMRDRQYFSIREVNVDLWDSLNNFNERPFQKKDGSRKSWFEEEKPFLLPLPEYPYEMAVWKKAKVAFNYHVEVEKKYYSCPSEYIHKVVDVRISPMLVEIYYGGARIASHMRLFSRDTIYSTNYEHMPEAHQQYSKLNGERFRSWAKKIGENTLTVVNFFLESPKVEQQGYKSCLALLKLNERYSNESIDAACQQMLAITHSPSLKGIKSILETPQQTLSEQSSYGINRGPE